MSLPKPIRPEYNTTIPSSGKKIKYQPFSVREEKVLILAAESGDMDEISNAISNVLSRCITSPADMAVEELALFDIEFLFLKARAKSAGEKLKINITDPDDDTYQVEHEINIDKIGIIKDKKHKKLIDINDTIQVNMRYPGVEFFAEGLKIDNISDSMETISRCIQSIVVEEEVFSAKDMSTQEITEWLENLTTEQFSKILEFFQTMPKLKHSITLLNKNTDRNFTVTLEGLADFF